MLAGAACIARTGCQRPLEKPRIASTFCARLAKLSQARRKCALREDCTPIIRPFVKHAKWRGALFLSGRLGVAISKIFLPDRPPRRRCGACSFSGAGDGNLSALLL